MAIFVILNNLYTGYIGIFTIPQKGIVFKSEAGYKPEGSLRQVGLKHKKATNLTYLLVYLDELCQDLVKLDCYPLPLLVNPGDHCSTLQGGAPVLAG